MEPKRSARSDSHISYTYMDVRQTPMHERRVLLAPLEACTIERARGHLGSFVLRLVRPPTGGGDGQRQRSA